jgi:hypothetical protein
MNRRSLLICTALVPLAACGTTSNPTLTPGQIVADVSGLLTVLKADVPLIAAADPQLMTPAQESNIEQQLAAAQVLAATVTPQLTATQGATTLLQVESDINIALDAISAAATAGSGPLAKYALAVQAAMVLSAGIEAWLNATLGLTAAHATVVHGMTPEQARAVLGIKIVS